MKNNVSSVFYLKKPKNYVSGTVPIYMRITVDGERKELFSGKNCEPDAWNSKANRMNGHRPRSKYFEQLEHNQLRNG